VLIAGPKFVGGPNVKSACAGDVLAQVT